jgi:hypothetical protein
MGPAHSRRNVTGTNDMKLHRSADAHERWGNVYALSPQPNRQVGTGSRQNDDPCAIATAMALHVVTVAGSSAVDRPAFLVLRALPQAEAADRASAPAAEWLVVPTVHELLDQLCARPKRWPLVIIDAVGETAKTVAATLAAIRLVGWEGRVVITDNGGLVERHAALRSKGVVLAPGGSAMYRRILADALGQQARAERLAKENGVGTQAACTSWVPRVISAFARYAGPGAGDVVRDEFHALHARSGATPQPEDLVARVAEHLNAWPAHKARFVQQCRH